MLSKTKRYSVLQANVPHQTERENYGQNGIIDLIKKDQWIWAVWIGLKAVANLWADAKTNSVVPRQKMKSEILTLFKLNGFEALKNDSCWLAIIAMTIYKTQH